MFGEHSLFVNDCILFYLCFPKRPNFSGIGVKLTVKKSKRQIINILVSLADFQSGTTVDRLMIRTPTNCVKKARFNFSSLKLLCSVASSRASIPLLHTATLPPPLSAGAHRSGRLQIHDRGQSQEAQVIQTGCEVGGRERQRPREM